MNDPLIHYLILALDIVGTFAFALSGAIAGVRRELDLFGVLVLSVGAATAGGVIRDVVIGAVPPAALSDWRYVGTAVLAGVITFRWHALIDRLRNPVQVFDAAGLALYAVTGAQKALEYGLDPVMAAVIGMVTGIGGGIARDVLLAGIPSVLRSELYAIAALAGASIVVAADALQLPSALAALLGAATCFVLRISAIRYRLGLPVARSRSRSDQPGE
jgi:uncharacterized membrane protein YeiH